VSQLTDRAGAKLSPEEIDLVWTILEGDRPADATAKSGLSGTTISALYRVTDSLHVYPRGLADAEPAGVTVPSAIAPSDAAATRISPIAFLRSMATLLWSAFRYPFRTTEVDLSTGKVIRHY
jgi:hypothetical protein